MNRLSKLRLMSTLSLCGFALLYGGARSQTQPRYRLSLRWIEVTPRQGLPDSLPQIGPPYTFPVLSDADDISTALSEADPRYVYRQVAVASAPVPVDEGSAQASTALVDEGTLSLKPLSMTASDSTGAHSEGPEKTDVRLALSVNSLESGMGITSQDTGIGGMKLGECYGFTATGPSDHSRQLALFACVTLDH